MCLCLSNYQQADSVAALVIALLTIATMFPLCVCSATILLQVGIKPFLINVLPLSLGFRNFLTAYVLYVSGLSIPFALALL